MKTHKLSKKQALNFFNWLAGLVLCGLGITLCTKANFGLSMIAAPPYILHVWLRDTLPWFSQGTSEYFWQALLLIITCAIIRHFEFKYILAFVTAVLSGIVLDFWLKVFGGNGAYTNLALRIIAFILGELVTSFAIAFYFRTSFPLAVYELSVMEISIHMHFDKIKVKQAFDVLMLIISFALSFILTHSLCGIGIGTVLITILNSFLINSFGKIIDKIEKTYN